MLPVFISVPWVLARGLRLPPAAAAALSADRTGLAVVVHP